MKKMLTLLFSAAIVCSLAMPVFGRGSGAGEETKKAEGPEEAAAAKTKAAKTHAAKTKAKAATKKEKVSAATEKKDTGKM